VATPAFRDEGEHHIHPLAKIDTGQRRGGRERARLIDKAALERGQGRASVTLASGADELGEVRRLVADLREDFRVVELADGRVSGPAKRHGAAVGPGDP
jgi:hypothetical protein